MAGEERFEVDEGEGLSCYVEDLMSYEVRAEVDWIRKPECHSMYVDLKTSMFIIVIGILDESSIGRFTYPVLLPLCRYCCVQNNCEFLALFFTRVIVKFFSNFLNF